MLFINRKWEGKDLHWGFSYKIKEHEKDLTIIGFYLFFPTSLPKFKQWEDFMTRNIMSKT